MDTNLNDKVSQLQNNPMMFRKYDPNFTITENIGIEAQMRDSARLSGGGRATKFMKEGFYFTPKNQTLDPISLPVTLTPKRIVNG